MNRVLKRLTKANRFVDAVPIQPPHVVVNIGNSTELDCRSQIVKFRMRALRAKQARAASTCAQGGVFSAHPAIYFTIAVFVFCVAGLRAWPY